MYPNAGHLIRQTAIRAPSCSHRVGLLTFVRRGAASGILRATQPSAASNDPLVFHSRRQRPMPPMPSALPREPTPVQMMHGLLSGRFVSAAEVFLPPQATVCHSGWDSVRTCLRSMEEGRIRTCVICCKDTRDGLPNNQVRVDTPGRPSVAQTRELFKMLDTRDVLKQLVLKGDKAFSELLSHYDPSAGTPCMQSPRSGQSDISDVENDDVENSSVLYRAIEQAMETPAHVAANCSGRNGFVPCWDDEPFDQVIRAFETSARVPIFSFAEDTGIMTLTRVFSATDLFTLLNRSDFFGKLDGSASAAFDRAMSAPARCTSAGNASRPLAVAKESDPVIQTLRKLVETGYTALPVVDEGDLRHPLGVISTRDFTSLLLRPHQQRIRGDSNLLASTMTFVSQIRQSDCLKAKFPSISVRHSTPLRNVVQRMLAADIQRIFILDDSAKLLALFSRTDLGRIVARTIEDLIAEDIAAGRGPD